MSTTNSNTTWGYTLAGSSLVEVLGATINFALGSSSTHPAGWDDAVAIQLASDLQAALVKAGFTDATCTVTKVEDTATTYTVSSGAFV